MKKMHPLTPWIRNLDEVGEPIRDQARRLDYRLEELHRLERNLMADREEFMSQVRGLWKGSEISQAKRTTLKKYAMENSQIS